MYKVIYIMYRVIYILPRCVLVYREWNKRGSGDHKGTGGEEKKVQFFKVKLLWEDLFGSGG
jgi:hypothetical protein